MVLLEQCLALAFPAPPLSEASRKSLPQQSLVGSELGRQYHGQKENPARWGDCVTGEETERTPARFWGM